MAILPILGVSQLVVGIFCSSPAQDGPAGGPAGLHRGEQKQRHPGAGHLHRRGPRHVPGGPRVAKCQERQGHVRVIFSSSESGKISD